MVESYSRYNFFKPYSVPFFKNKESQKLISKMILSVTMIQESMFNIDRVSNCNDCSFKADGIQEPSI